MVRSDLAVGTATADFDLLQAAPELKLISGGGLVLDAIPCFFIIFSLEGVDQLDHAPLTEHQDSVIALGRGHTVIEAPQGSSVLRQPCKIAFFYFNDHELTEIEPPVMRRSGYMWARGA